MSANENTTYVRLYTTRHGEDLHRVEISPNNRAATRQAIIDEIRSKGVNFITRSDWSAKHYSENDMEVDWDFTKIAIHHAGRSAACGVGHFQMQDIQKEHMDNPHIKGDIGYHYALDCSGRIYEGRDIRFKGSNVGAYNTGLIGIVLLENLTNTSDSLGSVFSTTVSSVPSIQKQTANVLITALKNHFYINILGGHREFPNQGSEGKICPGNIGMNFVYELRRSFGLSAP